MRERAPSVWVGALLCLSSLGVGADTVVTRATIDEGADARTYVVARPDSCSKACALVLELHGFGGSGEAQMAHSGLAANAGKNGYLLVAADGLHQSWNAGRSAFGGCCGFAMHHQIDDVAFLKDVVARVSAAYPVDRTRVYVSGWSNGCAMAQRLVAEAGDVFAAAACTGGYLLTMQKSLALPVSVTEIHAHDDEVSPYREEDDHTGARENAARWAAMNHCVSTPTHERLGGASDVARFEGCDAGVHVRGVTLARSGHDAYANKDGVDVAQLIWDSLREARRTAGQP